MFDLEFIKIIKMFLDFYEEGFKTVYTPVLNKNPVLSQTNNFKYIFEPLTIAKRPFIEWIFERYLQEYVNDKKTKYLSYSNNGLLPVII